MDNNPNVKIVNSTSIDIEIFDVYNNSGDPKGVLTYTSLGKIAAGDSQDIQTIHFASQLQAMYTGQISDLNNNYYYQFPVAVLPVSGFDDVTSYSFTDDDKVAMEQSFKFIKFTTANPDSNISKDFATALASDDQDTAVNDFFAKSASFKKCTIDSWSAVVSWQTQLFSAWQGLYYLYNTSDDGTQIKLIGEVNIVSDENDNSAVFTTANSDGSVNANDQSTTLVMTGSGSISEENVGMGDVSISLTPSWFSVLQTSKDGSTSYVIDSVLSGTIGSTKVLGSKEKITLPSSSGGGDGNSSGNSSGSKDSGSKDSGLDYAIKILNIVFSSLNVIVQTSMLLVMVMQLRKDKAQKVDDVANKSKNPKENEGEIKKEQAAVEEKAEPDIKKAAESGKDAVLNSSEEVAENQKKIAQEQQEEREKKSVRDSEQALEDDLKKNAPDAEDEKDAQDLEDANADINDGDLNGANDKIKQVNEDMNNRESQIERNMSEEQKKAYESERQNAEENQKQQEDIEDSQKKQEEEEEEKSNESENEEDEEGNGEGEGEFGEGEGLGDGEGFGEI